MKLSCLVVTKNRPEFFPWLTWNITKQTRMPDEIIIIDSTPLHAFSVAKAAAYQKYAASALQALGVHIGDLVYAADVSQEDPEVEASHDWTTGESRNLALDAASGDIITWIDDDDWHHPQKHEVLGAAIEHGYDIAYFPNTHRLILETMELLNIGETDGQVSVPFCAVRADIAHKHKFPHTYTAEDVHWLMKVKEDCKQVYFHRNWDLASMALIHDRNTWNRPDLPEYNYYKQITNTEFPTTAPYGVSTAEWEETRRQLAALKGRLKDAVR